MKIESKQSIKGRLWTAKFITLWQGQLVSTFGDAFYSIALGVWTLSVTHSTAYMGMLMAVTSLSGVIVSPFAGVLVDRLNRKRLLILMDFIRGISIVLIALAAFQMVLKIWMITMAGILLGVCGAIFRPGINSVIPDLVSKSKIENATSAFSVVSSGANMFGSASGGYLLQMIGAPFIFLINGFSYLFSCISICFIKIPKVEKNSRLDFFKDMKSGFYFVWKLKGMRYSLFMVAVFNFFFYIAVVLFLPLFQFTKELGIGKYGIVMGCFMFGAMAGYILMTMVKVPYNSRIIFFMIFIFASNICLIITVNMHMLIMMAIFVFFGGFFNSLINVMLLSIIQLSSPHEMRRKVQSLVSISSQGLTPFAMALGGILGSYFSIKLVIDVSFLMVMVLSIPFAFNKSFRSFMTVNYNNINAESYRNL